MRIRFVAAALVAALAASATGALALDVITREEIKETALEYGRYDQRFVTCKDGAADLDQDRLPQVREVAWRVEAYLDLASGSSTRVERRYATCASASRPRCKAKLESPKGQEILRNVEEWSKLPR